MVVHETREKIITFYQLFVNMVWDLWKSYACTFRCLALLKWERTSGRVQCKLLLAVTFSVLSWTLNLHWCILLASSGKITRCDHWIYCFLANQWVLFFAIPFLAHKDFSLTVHLKTAKCECLWSSAYCQVRMVVKLGNCQVRMFLKQCRTGGSSSYLLSKKIFMLKQKSSNLCMRCSNSVKKVLSNHLSTSHWHAFINALH